MKNEEMSEKVKGGGFLRLHSGIVPGDDYTAPMRVVLHESHKPGELVTHMQDMRDGAYYNGNYFLGTVAGALAIRDYLRRCESNLVDPFPPKAIQDIPAGLPRTTAETEPQLSDDVAERAGRAIALEFKLRHDLEYSDRYTTTEGTRTAKGVARRALRLLQFCESAEREREKKDIPAGVPQWWLEIGGTL